MDCQGIQRPCADALWESSCPLTLEDGKQSRKTSVGVCTTVLHLDLFGIVVPLMRLACFAHMAKPTLYSCAESRELTTYPHSILGDILEYHYLHQQHRVFNGVPGLVDCFRESIEKDLGLWALSFRRLFQGEEPAASIIQQLDNDEDINVRLETDDIESIPLAAIYGLHVYHCLHVLLYGKMDLIRISEDIEWMSSGDFIRVGRHSRCCAKVCRVLQLLPSKTWTTTIRG